MTLDEFIKLTAHLSPDRQIGIVINRKGTMCEIADIDVINGVLVLKTAPPQPKQKTSNAATAQN